MSSRTDPIAPHRRSTSNWRPTGFTLIELLVVIAIIGTLAAVVGPSIFRNVADARINAARSQIEIFGLALNAYHVDNGTYPSTEQGIEALRSAPLAGEIPRDWRGPYHAKVIVPDPWGNAYMYVSPGVVNPQSFDLYSLGRDGRPGGDGENRDITSWGGPVAR